MILFLFFSLIFTIVFVLLRAYIKNANNVIFNPFSYLLFFGLLYLCIPSIYFLIFYSSPLIGTLDVNTVNYTASISIYFMIIFLLGFLLSIRYAINPKELPVTLDKRILIILKIVTLLIVLYILFILVINYSILFEIYGNRRLQADFNTVLINKYKVYFLFNILCIIIAFLVLATKKNIHIIYLFPFVVIDILLSSRYLILITIIFTLLMLAYNKYYIKITHLVISVIFLVFLGLIRSTHLENIELIQSIYEFLFTYSAAFLIIDDNTYQANILDVLLFSVGKLCLIDITNFFSINGFTDYRVIMSELNPLSDRMGLGGSLIAEIISFKSKIIIGLIPIYLALYAFLINYFLRSDILWLRIYGVLFILFIFSFFRGAMFDHLLYPLYLMIYFGFWIFAFDVIRQNKIRRVS